MAFSISRETSEQLCQLFYDVLYDESVEELIQLFYIIPEIIVESEMMVSALLNLHRRQTGRGRSAPHFPIGTRR